MTKLIDAAKKGNTALVAGLLNDPQIRMGIDSGDQYRNTALIYAAYNGHKEVVALLLKAKAQVDKANNNGITAIVAAHSNHHTEIITKYLLPYWFEALQKPEANINIVDKENRTPFFMAVLYKHKSMATWLIDNGADVTISPPAGPMPLQNLFKCGDNYKDLAIKVLTKWFEVLKESVGDINKQDSEGKIPLHWAVEYAHKAMVTWLLNNGASPLINDNDFVSPIALARSKRNKATPVYAEIHELMHRKEFPEIYRPEVPEYVRTLLPGGKWSMPTDGSPLVIKYTYDQGRFDTTTRMGKRLASSGLLDGEPLNKLQRQAISEAMQYFETVLHIKFLRVEPTDENLQLYIRQANLTKKSNSAITSILTNSKGQIEMACLSLDSTLIDDPYKTYANTYYQFLKTIKHELGHVLRLDHPDPQYSQLHTIMSYNPEGLVDYVFPETLMPNDLEALLTMYPANKNHHINNTAYSINGDESHLKMLIDQGGTDVIDASSYPHNATIDLRPKEISTVGKNRFTIAPGSIIEDIKGAQGNNTIIDNDANNIIDLQHSTGNNIIHLTRGNDLVKLSNHSTSNNTITIDGRHGNGTKRITDFNPRRDKIRINTDNAARVSGDARYTKIQDNHLNIMLPGVSSSIPADDYLSYTTKVKPPSAPQVNIEILPDGTPINDHNDYVHIGHSSYQAQSTITNSPEQPCYHPNGTTNIIEHQGSPIHNALITECKLENTIPIPSSKTLLASSYGTAQSSFQTNFVHRYLSKLFIDQGMHPNEAALAAQGAIAATIGAVSPIGSAIYIGAQFVPWDSFGKWGQYGPMALNMAVNASFNTPSEMLGSMTGLVAGQELGNRVAEAAYAPVESFHKAKSWVERVMSSMTASQKKTIGG